MKRDKLIQKANNALNMTKESQSRHKKAYSDMDNSSETYYKSDTAKKSYSNMR